MRGHVRDGLDGTLRARYVSEVAEATDRGLRTTQGRVEEMSDYLHSARVALSAAGEALMHLDRLAETGEAVGVASLRERVARLDQAAGAVEPVVERARRRVSNARSNLEPMLDVTMSSAGPQSARVLMAGRIATEAATKNVWGAQDAINESRRGLDEVSGRAQFAVHGSAELSATARAARDAASPGFMQAKPQGRGTVTPIRKRAGMDSSQDAGRD